MDGTLERIDSSPNITILNQQGVKIHGYICHGGIHHGSATGGKANLKAFHPPLQYKVLALTDLIGEQTLTRLTYLEATDGGIS